MMWSSLGVAVAAIAVTSVVLRRLAVHWRPHLYDATIASMTAVWYRAVLQRLPNDSTFLDVGIGTGRALLSNADLLTSKRVTVVGVDYDQDYVLRCSELIREHGLQDACQVVHASIYDYQGGPFDAAYFSGSLMIMPNPVQALTHTAALLKPGGYIYCTQTFQLQRNAVLELIKPLLKYLTSIDFGNVTYEDEFIATLEAADLEVVYSGPVDTAMGEIDTSSRGDKVKRATTHSLSSTNATPHSNDASTRNNASRVAKLFVTRVRRW